MKRNFLNKSGASLLESLSVFAISLVLLGMTVPFYFSCISKSKLDASMRELSTIVRTARNFAITNNKNCELHIPITVTNSPEFRYRSIKLFQNGATIGEWHYLKDGIVFDERTSSGYSTFLNDPDCTDLRPFPYDSSPDAKVAVITFKPNGGIAAGNRTLCLRFANSNLKGKRITLINRTGIINEEDYNP